MGEIFFRLGISEKCIFETSELTINRSSISFHFSNKSKLHLNLLLNSSSAFQVAHGPKQTQIVWSQRFLRPPQGGAHYRPSCKMDFPHLLSHFQYSLLVHYFMALRCKLLINLSQPLYYFSNAVLIYHFFPQVFRALSQLTQFNS